MFRRNFCLEIVEISSEFYLYSIWHDSSRIKFENPSLSVLIIASFFLSDNQRNMKSHIQFDNFSFFFFLFISKTLNGVKKKNILKNSKTSLKQLFISRMYNNYLFIIHTKNNNIKYHKIFLSEIEKPLPLLFLIITSNSNPRSM